jgi:Lipocalin-like domain
LWQLPDLEVAMLKDKLLGTWKMISSEFRRADGQTTYPFGKNATGRIIYDTSGNMSAQIMRPGRPAFASGDSLRGTPEEIKAAFEGLLSYFGTYDVDEQKGTVTHHVESAYFPNWEGKDQVRIIGFDGERLTLSTPPIPAEGTTVTGVLTWERIG